VVRAELPDDDDVVDGRSVGAGDARQGKSHESVADELLRILRPVADDEARRHGISGYRADLLQEAFRRTWQAFREAGRRPTDREGRAIVQEIAREVAQEWRRITTREPAELDGLGLGAGVRPVFGSRGEAAPFDPVRTPRKGIPRLGRRIMTVAWGTRYERGLAEAVHSAACVIAPLSGVLRPGTYRIFALAYMAGWDAMEVAAAAETTERGATDRIDRIATRIESHLINRMRARDEQLLAEPTRCEGAGAPEEKPIFVSRPTTEVCVRAIFALGAVFMKTRGSSAP